MVITPRKSVWSPEPLSRFFIRLVTMLLSIIILFACGAVDSLDSQVISPPTPIDPFWGSILQQYSVAVGETVSIDLPQIPLTGKSEYWQINQEVRGDQSCFVESASYSEQEGVLSPNQIYGQAVCPGELHIILRVVDSTSGEEIPDVKPLDIFIDIQE